MEKQPIIDERPSPNEIKEKQDKIFIYQSVFSMIFILVAFLPINTGNFTLISKNLLSFNDIECGFVLPLMYVSFNGLGGLTLRKSKNKLTQLFNLNFMSMMIVTIILFYSGLQRVDYSFFTITLGMAPTIGLAMLFIYCISFKHLIKNLSQVR